MLNQFFFYDLKLIQHPLFTIRINVLFILIVLIIALLNKNTYPKLKYCSNAIYFIIIASLTGIFNFMPSSGIDINLDLFNQLNLFLKLLISNPIKSFMLPSYAYSVLYIVMFIPFRYFIKSNRLFFITVFSIEIIQHVLSLSYLGENNFSYYDIELAMIGYWLGYLFMDLYNIFQTKRQTS